MRNWKIPFSRWKGWILLLRKWHSRGLCRWGFNPETSLRHRAIVDELEELYQRWEGLLEQMESRNLTL